MSCSSNNKKSHNDTLSHLLLLMSEYLLRAECALEGDDDGYGIKTNAEIAHMVRMAQRMAQRAVELSDYCGQKHCPKWNGLADDLTPNDYPDDCDDDDDDDDSGYHESY